MHSKFVPAPAVRVPLSVFKEAVFHKSGGDYQPHEVEARNRLRFSRCAVWGNVVRVFEGDGFFSVTLDDFTGSIDVLAFEDNAALLSDVKEGEVVRVLGRVRQGKRGIYLLAEGVQLLSFREETLARADNVAAERARKKKIPKPAQKPTKEVKRDVEGEFVTADALKVERKKMVD